MWQTTAQAGDPETFDTATAFCQDEVDTRKRQSKVCSPDAVARQTVWCLPFL